MTMGGDLFASKNSKTSDVTANGLTTSAASSFAPGTRATST